MIRASPVSARAFDLFTATVRLTGLPGHGVFVVVGGKL